MVAAALPLLVSVTLPTVSPFISPLLVNAVVPKVVPKPYCVLVLLAVIVNAAGLTVNEPTMTRLLKLLPAMVRLVLPRL